MRLLLSLVLFAVGLADGSAANAVSSSVRQLVISAPDPEHPDYREQAALLLPTWRGLIERDFVIKTHFGSKVFSVVLIGKDGGEKLRRATPLLPSELFAIVDAMPMRQAEMKDRPPARP